MHINIRLGRICHHKTIFFPKGKKKVKCHQPTLPEGHKRKRKKFVSCCKKREEVLICASLLQAPLLTPILILCQKFTNPKTKYAESKDTTTTLLLTSWVFLSPSQVQLQLRRCKRQTLASQCLPSTTPPASFLSPLFFFFTCVCFSSHRLGSHPCLLNHQKVNLKLCPIRSH